MNRSVSIKGKVFWLSLALCATFVSPGAGVSSRTLGVEFDGRGAVAGITTRDGVRLDSEKGPAPLFHLVFTRTDSFTNRLEVWSDALKGKVEEPPSGGVRIVFDAPCAACERVVCTVTDGGEVLRWGISTEVKDGWALEETEYPRLRLRNDFGRGAEALRYVGGNAKGGICRPAREKSKWFRIGRQPGNLACQFGCLYDGVDGFYYAAEDGKGSAKRLGGSGDGRGVTFVSARIGFDTGSVTQDYEIVTGGFSGTAEDPCTWHDAADRYRAWAERQRWCVSPYRARSDVPGWMKDAPAMVRFTRAWMSEPESVRRWVRDFWSVEYPGVPLIAAFWGWEKHDNWITPDYFPVVCGDEAFAKLLGDLRRMNAHGFPWPSGYHWTLTYDRRADGSFVWDDRERFERLAATHAVEMRDGTRYNRVPSWLKGGSCACMCGGDPWTLEWWNREICLPLARLGCEMIQVDQVVGGAFPPCWSRHHPHAPNEGGWKTDVFRRQLATMRRTMQEAVDEPVVCYEEPCEQFNDFAAIQDYRDCETADEWASVFNYVYHEWLPCFQSNPRRNSRDWRAHQAADGQIPFISPARGDGLPPSAALANGGFEQVAADGRRPERWEPVAGYKGERWNGSFALDTEVRHSLARSLRLKVKEGECAVQVSQNVALEGALRPGSGRKMRLSAWLKTGVAGKGQGVNYCFLGASGGGRLAYPAAGAGWQRVASEFTVPAGASDLRVMMHLGGVGEVWVDDLRLEEVLADGSTREVIRPKEDDYARFMKRWIALYRGEGRDSMAYGRQVKPPRLASASADGGRPVAFVSAYAAPGGGRTVVVANATAVRQSVTLLDRGRYRVIELEPDEIKLIKWEE